MSKAIIGPYQRNHHIRFDETHLISKLLSNSDDHSIMIDVGAHHGSSLKPFLDLNWTVFAFEPDKSNRETLLKNFTPNSKLIIDHRAVSKTKGQEMPFYTSSESTGISGLNPFMPSHKEQYKIKTTTIDEIVSEQKIQYIDFLKIDVEGYDFFVLEGIPWENLKPKIIECEFENKKTIPLGYQFEDMAEYLVKKGYTVYVSEWHPVLKYGIPHDWNKLTKYPCKLTNEYSWGNILAFLDPPNDKDFLDKFNELTKTKNVDKKETQIKKPSHSGMKHIFKRIAQYYKRWPIFVVLLSTFLLLPLFSNSYLVLFGTVFSHLLVFFLIGHVAAKGDLSYDLTEKYNNENNNKINNLKTQQDQLRKEINELNNQLNNSKDQIVSLNQQTINLTSHIHLLKQEEEKLKNDLQALSQNFVHEINTISEKNETSISELKSEKDNELMQFNEKLTTYINNTKPTLDSALNTAGVSLELARLNAKYGRTAYHRLSELVQQHRNLKNIIFYFGHHKCATNWMRPIFKELANKYGWSYDIEGGKINQSLNLLSDTLIVCHVNATIDYIKSIPEQISWKAFHLVRDPRDVLISQYWSWKNSHQVNESEIIDFKRNSNNMSLENGLIDLIPKIRMAKQLIDWPFNKHDLILEVKYEDLINNPLNQMTSIFKHLELDLNDQEAEELILKFNFKSMTKRDLGVEDKTSHFRKGTPGDWKNYFNENLTKTFKEYHNQLILDLGYEKDENWSFESNS